MDQNAPNGSGKSSWRDRLGLGNKEIPKIADEFQPPRKGAAAPNLAVKTAPKPMAKVPMVAKPAPMAPRPGAPNGAKSAQGSMGRPAITPQNGPTLADRLKAQREAAEKLAEQRVSAAREKADVAPAMTANGNGAAKPPPSRPAMATPPLASMAPAAAAPSPPPGKPKFSFAEEDAVAAAAGAAKPDKPAPTFPSSAAGRDFKPVFQPKPAPPPIIPPRPSLGGERMVPSLGAPAPSFDPRPRPPGTGFLPPGSAMPPGMPPGGYKPLDPPGGFQSRANPIPPPRSYPPQGYDDQQLAARREAYDNYRRSPGSEAPTMGDDVFRDDPRRAPQRPPIQARGRQPAYEDEMGDVFEDEAQPKKRASAREYRQAYDDYDSAFEGEDRRRSTGPWVILLSMLALAVILGGGYWYWNKNLRTASVQTGTGEVPLVPAPETPAKTEADPAVAAGGDTAPGKSKQIYDRILGEQTLDGNKIVPTEEAPIAPSPQAPPATTGDAQDAQPPGAAEPIPMPAASTTTETIMPAAGTAGESDEPLPLPMPPPPGDTGSQGALPGDGTSQQSALSAPDSVPEPAGIGSSATETPPAAAAPRAAQTDDSASLDIQDAEPADSAPAAPVVKKPAKRTEPSAKQKAKEAAAAKARKKAKQSDDAPTASTEPVVLVPPADGAATGQQSADGAAPKRSGSFFDSLKGSNDGNSTFKKMMRDKEGVTPGPSSSAAPAVISGDDSADATQVAAVEEPAIVEKPKQPETQATAPAAGGTGYVVQLGSFRSEAEALAEMDRIKSRHGGVVGGMPTRISQATVAGSTRYRAGVGPAASRDDANKICSSLLAAGERDCIVRRQ